MDRNKIRFDRAQSVRFVLKLVECVPNFSEGRRKEVIEAIVAEARSRNVKVLDIESDPDHNRSVMTFVGSPEAVKEAALAISAKAIELIDLNKHKGQHPRMGAVDVVPFIPISDVTMLECVQLSKEFAKEYSSRFKVPVYLYEEAATRQDRRNLADVRKGEFEGLRDEIGKNPERIPDFGPNAVHPTAGATAIGARQILIAYNVNLGTNNLDIAKQIAKQLRGKDGGLSSVKALGFELEDRGIVQVSMNMVDYKASQLFKAFELVRTFADRFGVPVIGSEIVGLVPTEALTDAAEFYLRLQGFSKNQILERKLTGNDEGKLISLTLSSFGTEVASEKAVPGGGSVSAYAASLAASLLCMVSRLTLKKKEYEKHWPEVENVLEKAEASRQHLIALVDEDAQSFANLMKAYKLPKSTDQEKQVRSSEIQNGLRGAAEVPLATAEASANVLSLAKSLSVSANPSVISDLQTAAHLAYAGALGAIANVTINLEGMKDELYREQTQSRLDALQKQIENERSEALASISSRAEKKGV
jgi:glutamate formiminotransferase/formiminotetrahydrofolate cyclodeaminase